MKFSIVTPVFNRKDQVLISLRSSFRFIRECGVPGEVVVIDDASTDGSCEGVCEAFPQELIQGILKVVHLPLNLGVTAAKQEGVREAKGDWLLFMDSDDSFRKGCGGEVARVLFNAQLESPVVFFRCVEYGSEKLVGEPLDRPIEMSLRDFLRNGTPGECLPVVRRHALLEIPYEVDLRGFEFLTYARIVKYYGPARVEPFVVRIYSTEVDGDRLSTRQAVRRRGCQLMRGYIRMLAGFWKELGVSIFSIMMRILYHGMNCIALQIFKRA